MKDFNISTSLICCDLANVSQDVDAIVENGYKWFHADFMDGHFVPRYGISPELIQHLRKRYGNSIVIDSHLMVDDPFTYAPVIAPYSDWFIFHYEATTDPVRTLQMLRKTYPKLQIGLAFNLMSFINAGENFKECIWMLYNQHLIDGVMFMGISPGVLGTSSYFQIVYNKIAAIRSDSILQDLKIFIDGSVNYSTIYDYYYFGANVCVSGSSMMFKQPENQQFDRKELIKFNILKINNTIKNE